MAPGAEAGELVRLLGRDPDPAKSREHVLLSVLAERRLAAGQSAAALNTLLAAPTFASWRKGLTLDIGEWMQPVDGRRARTDHP